MKILPTLPLTLVEASLAKAIESPARMLTFICSVTCDISAYFKPSDENTPGMYSLPRSYGTSQILGMLLGLVILADDLSVFSLLRREEEPYKDRALMFSNSLLIQRKYMPPRSLLIYSKNCFLSLSSQGKEYSIHVQDLEEYSQPQSKLICLPPGSRLTISRSDSVRRL